ncbi:hypothetical protein K2173_023071 [Erythroxylum novogranatense]|uniref:SGTA homodimerisation domain-containing protein n=1 Tax=Erythroxylum novogranatense TaxID=1862640 RepID=A0AAV8T829_9ROSI|nr:hypothetical protein K2173_023071 [Erythroxylum novogranatense]
MDILKTDSPLSRRIVRAFLDFLNSVEPATGVDSEGLEVAKECLTEAFRLNLPPSPDDSVEPGLLATIFRALEANYQHNISFDGAKIVADVNHSESSKTQGEDSAGEPVGIGTSVDELFGQFVAALEKIHFFKTTSDGNDDPNQLDVATRLFHEALKEMEATGCQSYDRNSLAETLKSLGNKALQSKCYSHAIELYSFAISLRENNAVYFSNRAAAYTQIHNYNEAIKDCFKSIEIDPKYSKAYSRLGLAYYAQGNYSDAIHKGFKKALQLDPNNESIKENIQVAEQKLKQQSQWTESDERTGPSGYGNQNQSSGVSGGHGIPPFSTLPFDISAVPTEFANMLGKVMANVNVGQHVQNREGEDGNVDGSDRPDARTGGNINLNLGEILPEELSGTLNSVMEMFSGAARNPQDSTTEDHEQTKPS